MTLNLEWLLLCVISPNLVVLGANYVKLVICIRNVAQTIWFSGTENHQCEPAHLHTHVS